MDEQLEQEVNLLHASICQALADPKRILILYALHEGPKTVTELTGQLQCAAADGVASPEGPARAQAGGD